MSANKEKFDVLGYYNALELAFDATADAIKHNYRNIAKIWHPDQNSSDEALEKFQKISVAYDVLKDDKKRLIYDLLSQVYSEENLPDMFLLKPYKDSKNSNDVFVRSIKLRSVVGKALSYTDKIKSNICSFQEAKKFVLQVSFSNWLLGWWSPKSFLINAKAIIANIRNIEKNNDENLRLLIHNALAYWQENKKEEAVLSMIQAVDYANLYQKKLLNKLGAYIDFKVAKKQSPWSYTKLKLLQLIFPSMLLIMVLLPFSGNVATIKDLQNAIYSKKTDEMNFYQEVKFSVTGGRIIDDVLVAKIVDIPVDIEDLSKLFHVGSKAKVMHAPGDEFDVLTIIEKNTTVRVTGYSPDNVWYRIMLDNGEMGFVRKENLKRGIRKEIPEDSKIYKRIQ